MNEIDYAKLLEITVKSQEELDMIPDNYAGKIFIKFGTRLLPAFVNKMWKGYVIACGNSSVVAWGNSSVEAWDNSSVEARDNSSVKARENSYVVAWENSSVVAWDNSSVLARGNSSVVAWGNSSVVAWDNSSVVARDNSSVKARDNSSVIACGNSSVEAWGNSSVVAWDNSSVVAWGNSQITNFQPTEARIQISGNSRIVYNPKTVEEYVSFYGIKHNKKTGRFFKAVHRAEDGTLYSDYNHSFRYMIGETIREVCNPDVTKRCSYGIHIAHLDWALNFGATWSNLAIIEVETDLDKVVVPVTGDGKVRTSEVKVLREVPLKECGAYGEMLARRRLRYLLGKINPSKT